MADFDRVLKIEHGSQESQNDFSIGLLLQIKFSESFLDDGFERQINAISQKVQVQVNKQDHSKLQLLDLNKPDIYMQFRNFYIKSQISPPNLCPESTSYRSVGKSWCCKVGGEALKFLVG